MNIDTLRPDTVEILQSSFLEERPALPALFFPPPWQAEMSYSLYPNDPGVGDFALAFKANVVDTGITLASDGLFLIDRSSGRLTYLLKHYVDENGNSRSAEYCFGENESALILRKVVEHMTRGAVARSGYYIVETYVLDIRLK